jgi:hypothetical protein
VGTVQAVEGGGNLAAARTAHEHFEAQDFLSGPRGFAPCVRWGGFNRLVV